MVQVVPLFSTQH